MMKASATLLVVISWVLWAFWTAAPARAANAERAAATGAAASAAVQAAGVQSPSSTTTPAASAPPAPSGPTPIPAPPALVKLTPVESKRLLEEFRNAQVTDLRAMDHRQQLELKELKASQAARRKEWDRSENAARAKFFHEHHGKGAEERAYMHELFTRRDAFFKLMADEKTHRDQEADVAYKALKEEQVQKLKEFKASLARGERPPQSLWPQNFH